jgi:antagonist of KipI
MRSSIERGSIEILNPGWLSIVVDKGRFGYGEAGVPTSSALDSAACTACNALLGRGDSAPLLEVMGPGFRFRAESDMTVAIAGARATIEIEGRKRDSWSSFKVKRGERVTMGEIVEGFRYYVGFSGGIDIRTAMGSATTNLECGFGGFKGRPLVKGDVVRLKGLRPVPERQVADELIPSMKAPHRIHFIEGPEADFFDKDGWENLCKDSERLWYTVSSNSNRAGIRLEGSPLLFRKGVKESIVSEGVLPGTIQVPAGGMPIIILHERTTGGYARIGVVVQSSLDRLAHLKPRDKVIFERISVEEARRLRMSQRQRSFELLNQVRRSL